MSWVFAASDTVNDGGTSSASLQVPTGFSVAAGDLVICTATYDFNGPTSAVVDDPLLGNTFQARTAIFDNVQSQFIQKFFCVVTNAGTIKPRLRYNPTPGTTTAGGGDSAFIAEKFTGSDSSTVTDGYLGANSVTPGTGANLVTSGNITTATNGDLIHSAVVDSSTGTNTVTLGTGFTAGTTSGAGAAVVRTAYRIQSAAGAIAGTWTSGSNGNTDRFLVDVIAFTPASGGGGGGTPVQGKSFGSQDTQDPDPDTSNLIAIGAAGPGIILQPFVGKTFTNPIVETPVDLETPLSFSGRGRSLGVIQSPAAHKNVSIIFSPGTLDYTPEFDTGIRVSNSRAGLSPSPTYKKNFISPAQMAVDVSYDVQTENSLYGVFRSRPHIGTTPVVSSYIYHGGFVGVFVGTRLDGR